MLHIFIAEGFEEIEAFATIDILRRCNLEVAVVSITGTRMIKGAHGITILADTVFRKGTLTDSQAFILPGGMPGAQNLRHHEGLRKALLLQHSNRRLIAAICAAPMVLGEHGLLEGKKATCYPGFEPSLKGAEVIDNEMVVEDGNFITAKGPAAAVDFAFAIAKRFVDSQLVAEVRSGMLFT